MRSKYVLKGDLGRVGVESPNTPAPIKRDLSKISLEIKLNGISPKIYQDSNSSELYIIDGKDLYSAKFTENEQGELILRDKQYLADRAIPINHNEDKIFHFEKDGQPLCLIYSRKDILKKEADLKKESHYGTLISRLKKLNTQ